MTSEKQLLSSLSIMLSFLIALFIAPGNLRAESKSRLSNKPIPMKTSEEMPKRVSPLIEIGNGFLRPGNIPSGFELPTGAVWIPSLWVYGNVDTGFNYNDVDENVDRRTEAVVSTNLNFHLNLTGTERIFLQLTPLNSKETSTRYTFEPERSQFSSHLNLDVQSLFFEGDFGEIFPKLDPLDSASLDIGMAVGRQAIFFQEGIMINDTMDALALVRDSLIFKNIIDTKFSFLWAWNNVERSNNTQDANAKLYGLFTEADYGNHSLRFDAAYLDSDTESGGDGLFLGVSSVQRIKGYNTAFYANWSHAMDDQSAVVRDGFVLFSEISTTPIGNHNLVYFNSFVGIDDYSSASRGRTAGGPIGRAGIMFAAPGLGSFGAPLGNNVNESVGAALGYQAFFNDDRTQIVAELAGIESAAETDLVQDGVAVGVQLQQKLYERYRITLTGFATDREVAGTGIGLQMRFLTQF